MNNNRPRFFPDTGKTTAECMNIKTYIFVGLKSWAVKKYSKVYRPEYCSTLWSPSSKKPQMELERVQRRFTKQLRGMCSLKYEERLSELGLVTLTKRRSFLDLVMMYSCQNAKSLFTFTKHTHDHDLRGHPLKVNIPDPKINRERAAFVYRTAVLWNKLPPEVFSDSISVFKVLCLDSVNKLVV